MSKFSVQSIRLKNFKRFDNFYISARNGNVLVGPNNSGKSSILDALRIASSCLRFARTRPPRPINISGAGPVLGYNLPDASLPIPIANVTTNYSGEDAIIEIRCTNGNTLVIRLNPERETSFYLVSETDNPRTTQAFRKAIPFDLVIVPPLGPFEETERIVTDETIRRNETSRLSNRYFRHIWLQRDRDEFSEFEALLSATWPGIGIKFPEILHAGMQPPSIQMYFSENRIDRELYWAGFGFQVWLQLLTHILRGSPQSILVLDEPDIYLHPDLQRKLLRLASDRFGQFFLATHSIEIINEADPGDVLSIDSHARAAKRVQTDEEYQSLFKYLGSIENIDFSRLGRARRIIFFEGNDKKILRKYATKLGAENFANDPDTMILQSGGFTQWRRVKEVAWTFKEVLKIDVDIFALFDRDYRSQEETDKFLLEMTDQGIRCHVLGRKEIENYCLTLKNLIRTIKSRQEQRLLATQQLSSNQIRRLVDAVSQQFKHDTSAQIIAHRMKYFQETRSKVDSSTILKETSKSVEEAWKDLDQRLSMLSGKDFVSQLSARLQKRKGFSVTINMLVDALPKEEVPSDLSKIILELDGFCAREAI